MSKSTMTLKLHEKGWMATFDDQNFIDEFGTDTLPTGFTEHASPEMVLEMLQNLNPHLDVRLAEEEA